MKSLKVTLIISVDMKYVEPQSEEVDELSATEKAEPHTEANNATKDANELLQNYNLDLELHFTLLSKAFTLGSAFVFKSLCQCQCMT